MTSSPTPCCAPRRGLVLAGLSYLAMPPAHAALWGERVDGNRRIAHQERAVAGFHGLALGVPAQVQLRQGDAEGLSLEGDDNILPLVEARVEQGTLQVRPVRRNLELSPSVLRLVLRLRDLDEIAIGGAGSVSADALRARRLQLGLGGAGRIALDGLQAGELEVGVAGSGRVRLAGMARRIGISVGGSGEVLAEKLQAAVGEVSIGRFGRAGLGHRPAGGRHRGLRARALLGRAGARVLGGGERAPGAWGRAALSLPQRTRGHAPGASGASGAPGAAKPGTALGFPGPNPHGHY